MSTSRTIQITDYKNTRLTLAQDPDGTLTAQVHPPGPIDLDEVDRQRLRDFLAGS